ncbi:thioesterase II family protein [Pseudomonas fontis]|uniref:Thioesterase domain-containing protein n=1 Tax=Pseudomonas fontis TaxID=2942633 RepID=A0ABT5NXW0_9PSED|nr:alpha/beta fold hydrolase [Pseudomonas fontis]MDD0972522.1 thioesterase domain-containing protein [Pseudomonas fontis]MDD0993046.1 thioesterase domain-containing protein [Pseudomonas fontis]
MAAPSPWLVRRPAPDARVRLFCFSHAGGSATDYLPWHPSLAPAIELCALQLPGRGSRMAEPALAEMPAVLAGLAEAIASSDDGLPYAFFGHSLGALLAFEVTRLLRERGMRLPIHLFASGCSAPSTCRLEPALHLLSDSELLAHLQTYNGTPKALLANQELLGLVLPTLRADFSLIGHYVHQPQPALAVAISVLAGRDDPHVRPDDLLGWSEQTHLGCEVHWYDGDHFFIRPRAQAIQQHILQTLVGSHVFRRETHPWP